MRNKTLGFLNKVIGSSNVLQTGVSTDDPWILMGAYDVEVINHSGSIDAGDIGRVSKNSEYGVMLLGHEIYEEYEKLINNHTKKDYSIDHGTTLDKYEVGILGKKRKGVSFTGLNIGIDDKGNSLRGSKNALEKSKAENITPYTGQLKYLYENSDGTEETLLLNMENGVVKTTEVLNGNQIDKSNIIE